MPCHISSQENKEDVFVPSFSIVRVLPLGTIILTPGVKAIWQLTSVKFPQSVKSESIRYRSFVKGLAEEQGIAVVKLKGFDV
jgi:hypothetical protein